MPVSEICAGWVIYVQNLIVVQTRIHGGIGILLKSIIPIDCLSVAAQGSPKKSVRGPILEILDCISNYNALRRATQIGSSSRTNVFTDFSANIWIGRVIQ